MIFKNFVSYEDLHGQRRFVTINCQLRVCFIHVGRRLPINKLISHSIRIAQLKKIGVMLMIIQIFY